MKKKVNIYVLLDPSTCKVRYIGITTQSIKRRLFKHVEDAMYSKKSTHKINWIRKLISEGKFPLIKKLTEVNDWYSALKLEKHLIKKYKVSRNLTNNEDYIDGAFKRTVTDEQRVSASKKAKSFYERGGKASHRKEVNCYKLDGTFVRKFDSMSEAAKTLNLSLRHVCLVVSGKKPQLKGYVFTKITEAAPENLQFDPNWAKKKKIKVLDLESGICKTYSSRTELAKELGVTNSAINYYLKNPSSLKNKKIEII